MSQKKWYYINASMQKVGPITSQALKVLAGNGIITRTTTLIVEDGSQMVEAGQVKGLFPEQSSSSSPGSANTSASSMIPPVTTATSHGQPTNDPWNMSANVNPFPTSQVSNTAWNMPEATDPFSPFPSQLPSQLPDSNEQWSMPSVMDPFPSAANSYQDPFAPPYQQTPFDRAPASKKTYSEPGALIVCGGAALLIFLFCSFVFIVTSIVSRKPAAVAEKPVEDAVQETIPGAIADAPVLKKERRATETGTPFLEVSAEYVESDEGIGQRSRLQSGTGRSPVRQSLPKPSVFQHKPDEPASNAVNRQEEPPPGKVIPMPERKERKGKRDTEEIVAETESSVALINGKRGSGSGFVVLPGIVATNSHVIGSEKIDEIEVIFPSETGAKKGPFSAKLLYEDAARDLAFLEIPTKDHTLLQVVQDYKFRRGQRVIAIGNPGLGDGQILENAVSEGILSTQTEVEKQPYYQLSISINVGNSGGPVFTDEGDVLGVVTLKGAQTEGVAFCIPPDALNQAVETVRKSDPQVIEQARKLHDSRIYLQRGIDRLRLLSQIPPTRQHDFAQEAIKDFDEAVRRTPREPDAFLGRGIFRAILGDIDGALRDFEMAARLAPDRKELAELRDIARRERDKQNQLADGGRRGQPQFIPLDQLQRLRPDIGSAPMSPQDATMREGRYQQIVKKEEWTFNGKPLRGRLVGYEDGIAHFQPIDDENAELIKRYANRFSRQDISDIIFYARYNGLPLGNLRLK